MRTTDQAGGRAGGQPWTARWVGIRIGLLAVVLAAGFGAVAIRAVQLQVVRPELESSGWLSELKLRPRRGAITDRSGNPLAASADAQSAYIDPDLFFGDWSRPKPETEPLAGAERRQREAMLRKLARLAGQDPARSASPRPIADRSCSSIPPRA